MKNTLYIIATPIGNLEDISLRALRLFKELPVLYCEDTRMTRKLLSAYDIDPAPRLKTFNAHASESDIARVLEELLEHPVGYVSDAGTPAISDPGGRLVAAARAAGFPVVPVPGPSALTTALSAAGVPADRFYFAGFLPQKKGRAGRLKELLTKPETVVLFESPHRIMKLLEALLQEAPERQLTLARELTKYHETFLSGSPQELLETLTHNPQQQKGEFVVILHPLRYNGGNENAGT